METAEKYLSEPEYGQMIIEYIALEIEPKPKETLKVMLKP